MNTLLRRYLLSICHRLHYEALPDKIFLHIKYYLVMGKKLNLDNPKTFTEKIQWLKLNNRKVEYTTMVDKFAVKEYVANLIGEQYIIPTINSWTTTKDIDFDQLPNKFVLKTNNGGGSSGVVICKIKNDLNIKDAITKLERSLKNNIYTSYREWPYKNIKPLIFAEQYMEDKNNEELTDYKFYCFNGNPTYCQVITNRNRGETIDFYDMNWQHMPFYGLNPKCRQAIKLTEKPVALPKMIEIAKILSQNIPFVRIDLYYINGKVYFGEITFFPASGMGVFTPNIWNIRLGEMINLPRINTTTLL